MKTKLMLGVFGTIFFIVVHAASPLDDWTVNEPWPPVGNVRNVFTDGISFVVVTDYKLVYSPDGTQWDQNYPLPEGGIASASFVFANGKYVANYGKTLWTSTNGTNWTSVSLPTGGNGIAYANGQYVIGGEMGIMISQDASHWTKVEIYRVLSAYNPVFLDGRWHIISDRSELYSTTNFVTWSSVKLPSTGQIVSGNDVYLLKGRGYIYSSRDLTNWTQSVCLTSAQMAFGGKHFVSVGGLTQDGIHVSTDGINWIEKQNGNFYSVVFGNNRFVALRAGTSFVHTSGILPENPDYQLSIDRFTGVQLYGVIGRRYTIQATPDLSNTNEWKTVDSFILQTDPYVWIDKSSPFQTKRFYRAIPE